jgi:hypothetical protein
VSTAKTRHLAFATFLALGFQLLACPGTLAQEDPVRKCSQEMSQQPRFADIAVKLPLMDIRQISFAMLADESLPTAKERKEISSWFDEHEACRKAGDEFRRTQYPPDIYLVLQEGETRARTIGVESTLRIRLPARINIAHSGRQNSFSTASTH